MNLISLQVLKQFKDSLVFSNLYSDVEREGILKTHKQ